MLTGRVAHPRQSYVVATGVIVALVLLGVSLRLHALPVASRTPDEQVYTGYANQIRHDGLGSIVTSTRQYIANPELHVFPPPTRFGFNIPGAVAMALTGRSNADAIAWMSTLVSGALLAMVAYFTFRVRGRWVAVGALAFLVASPVDLAMARRAWGDELLGVTAFAMLLALVMHRAEPRGRVWGPVALALGVWAVWQKETGLLVLGVATLGYLTAPRLAPRERLRLLRWAALAGVVTLAGLMLASGGLGNLVEVLRANTRSVARNEYAQQYQTGGPMYYVRGFALLQAVPIALGCVGVVRTLIRRHWPSRPRTPPPDDELVVLAWFVLVLLGVALCYSPKNLRYVSVVYAPLYILAAAQLHDLARSLAAQRWGSLRNIYVVIGVLLAGLSLHDYQTFDRYFIKRSIPDLATPWFTGQPNRPRR